MKIEKIYKIINIIMIIFLIIMILINFIRQDLFWAIIDLQILVYWIIVDDINYRIKKEKFNDEWRLIQTKALIKILNLLEENKKGKSESE